MEALTKLRQLARERRDKAISIANTLYADTLKQIAALEQDLLGQQRNKQRGVPECVQLAMPADRPFTAVDVRAALEELEPGRVWYHRTIANNLSRLCRRGFLKRLRRTTQQQPALYVRAAAVSDLVPSEPKTLMDEAEGLLRQRSMTPTELAVAIGENGYKTRMESKALRRELQIEMKRQPERFAELGGKWALVQYSSTPRLQKSWNRKHG